jgi:hypothetical protein
LAKKKIQNKVIMCQPQDDEHQTMSGKQIKTNKLERVVLKDDQHCYRLNGN